MASLPRELRNDLGNKVRDARRIAEMGARKVIESLAVHHHEPWASMSPADRKLRNRLRAHGRQLGDQLDPKSSTQTIEHLVSEVAYEHWHGMLFARFLAENDLLLMPDTTTAITLDEVEEIAKEQGRDWLTVVSEYAEKMLPQIFRSGDPALEVTLPLEARKALEDIVRGLSQQVFTADDSLGWVYQFWQADLKDEINNSGRKIGADELPAVTQLFTEDYMVLFLLHNTLGAWWAGKILAARPELARSAKNEDELRAACKVGDVEWTYLRFVRDAARDGTEGQWVPAAGTFEGWPTAARDITVLDPCMGSGHFLVFALSILVALRMAEEDLSQPDAIDAVLHDNLFGLEIDPRCTQIAAFNLAFAAWRRIGHRRLPPLNLACSGLAIGVTKAEWLRLGEKAVATADPAAKRDLLGVEENLLTVGLEERVKNGLSTLYDLFSKAPWLGSLISPRRTDTDIFREGFDQLEPLLTSILSAADTDDVREVAVAASGMAKAAELVSQKYTLVATNVPYLGRNKQDPIITEYIDATAPISRPDLYATFFLRCLELSIDGGACCIVSPQAWFFQKSFRPLRKFVTDNSSLSMLVDLGRAAFDDMNWWAATTALTITKIAAPTPESRYCILDASSNKGSRSKSKNVQIGNLVCVPYKHLISSDDRLVFISTPDHAQTKLGDYAQVLQGVGTTDLPRFTLSFWEKDVVDDDWDYYQLAPTDELSGFSGGTDILKWELGAGDLARIQTAHKGLKAKGRIGWGVAVNNSLRVTKFLGTRFDCTVAVLLPNSSEYALAIHAFLTDPKFKSEVKRVDQALSVTEASFLKVPFDVSYWSDVALARFPNGVPPTSTSDATQWVFDGRPRTAAKPLQVAVARLMGYSWPRQTGSDFKECLAVCADGLQHHADADGVVCLAALKGESPAEQRLNALLADAYGAEWSAAHLADLLAEVGYAGKSLNDWLRDGFSAQHCELFHQRPFVWQVWDGRRDGFNALVNYHRLAAPDGEGLRTLDKLIYTYLGAWIELQEGDQKAGVDGAEGRLAAARHLKDELEKIRRGEPPYDIFVRWKSLANQPKGWNPDINDGVRINIRPFMTARPLGAKAKNACILRSTPRISWDKDRGKEPYRTKEEFPWFWKWDGEAKDFRGGDEFDGARWNDLHYSLSAKEKASEDKGAA
jgi:hypothetical protein